MLRTTARTAKAALASCAALAVLVPVSASGALPRGGERYAGKTEEGLGVSLRASRGGGYVARFAIRYRVTCDNDAEGTVATEVFDVAIQPDGEFQYDGTYRKRVDRSRNQVKLRGRVSRRAARGTFSLRAVARPEGAESRVRCASERVSWRVKRTN